MKVVVFGATGMVRQGVVRECLKDPRVARVFTVGRTATGQSDPKVRDIVPPDLFDAASYADAIAECDACFFCLGVSSAGMSEGDYRRITCDLTIAIARALVERNPKMTFVFVSGQGTDGTGRSRWMWARVKGEAPNHVTSTEQVGRAMLAVADHGAPLRVLETPDINRVAAPASG